ncbi:unnamed protein product, partial [Timema podura]|nr:unnamed protein product [Timema podura]
RMQARMVEQMDISLTELVGEVLQEVEQTTLSPEHLYNSVEGNLKYKNRVKTKGTLSDKQFLPRNSVLTDLFQIKHIRTIYNIFCVILIILFLNTAVYDLVTTGKLNLGIELIVWNFTGLQTAVLIWLGMMSTTIVLFCCFSLWATKRVCVAAN